MKYTKSNSQVNNGEEQSLGAAVIPPTGIRISLRRQNHAILQRHRPIDSRSIDVHKWYPCATRC